MKRLHGKVRAICAVQLILLLTSVLPADALPSTDHVQTYVSRRGSIDLVLDGPANFLLAQHQDDSIPVNREVSRKLKDPAVALLYAAVPGLFVHGAGHFYAGEKTVGWVLVGGEILSLCVMTYAVGVGLGESTNGSTSSGNADIVAIFGGALFVGTWVYDIIGAPLAVQKENRELLGGENVRLRFGLDHTNHSVRVQIAKTF